MTLGALRLQTSALLDQGEVFDLDSIICSDIDRWQSLCMSRESECLLPTTSRLIVNDRERITL